MGEREKMVATAEPSVSGSFRKRPIVIEAVLWTGENFDEVTSFFGVAEFENGYVLVETMEGTMKAARGDWIIRGVRGEFYPCKPDIFEATYEPVLTQPTLSTPKSSDSGVSDG